MEEYEIVIYSTPQGQEPFSKWMHSLKEKKAQRIILLRIQRIRQGLFGDCKSIKNSKGLYELRIDYGPGFRVYFARIGDKLILLLGGGDKRSQNKDTIQIKKYFSDYKEEKHE